MKNILVTGAAGFIGYHVSSSLMEQGINVIGLDNLNDYYDVDLKYARLQLLSEHKSFRFYEASLENLDYLNDIFTSQKVDGVINLAAQAGVRHSIAYPHEYMKSNLEGFLNILECCRHHKVKHLVFASSSSVYGLNQQYPLKESSDTDHPIALYGATKKANEVMAHSYAHLYNIPCSGLRFFTVYGPWGRPDMALFKFTKNIIEEKSIEVFNHGDMIRDFTYIDDITKGVIEALFHPPHKNNKWNAKSPSSDTSSAPYIIYNIGRSKPINLMKYVSSIEKCAEKKAKIQFLPMQDGDVQKTYADTSKLHENTGYSPSIDTEQGVAKFVDWYKEWYKSEKYLMLSSNWQSNHKCSSAHS